MSDKKHIDRLFQERLKDLDVTPSPEVWNGVEAELKANKKSKRTIPIWWQTTGIAALLLLFIGIGDFIFNFNTESSPRIIVNRPISEPINLDIDTLNTSNETDKITPHSTTQITTTQGEVLIDDKNKTTPHINRIKKKTNSNGKQSASSLETSALVENKSNNMSQKKEPFTTTDAVASQEQETPNQTIAQSTSELVLNTPKAGSNNSKTTSVETNSIIEKSDKNLDSISIEEAIAETKLPPNKEQQSKKWDVQPNIAPVFYGSTGTGSHLDNEFINNSKSGEVNTSYGISVGYAINQKIKIRSGVNNLKLSFNTNDIIFFENPGGNSRNSNHLDHVSLSNAHQNITLLSVNNTGDTQYNTLLNVTETNAINQSINYFEVPLELEYNLLNKRFSINVIGGFSTFILEKNAIYSEGNSNRDFIGEATNINTVSFSSNLGLGFDYNISDRFNFNLEPSFKYQLNAYDKVYGSFKPYIIGIYTGFSYKF